MLDEIKPGFKTTEFWTTTVAGLVVPQLVSGLPGWIKVVAATATACVYAISRGLAKLRKV